MPSLSLNVKFVVSRTHLRFMPVQRPISVHLDVIFSLSTRSVIINFVPNVLTGIVLALITIYRAHLEFL